MQHRTTDAYAAVLRLCIAGVAPAEDVDFGFLAALFFTAGFFATGFFTAAVFALGILTAGGAIFFAAMGADFGTVFRATVFALAAGFFVLINFAVAGAREVTTVLVLAFGLAFDFAFTAVLSFVFAVGFTLATAFAFGISARAAALRFGAAGFGNSSVPSLHNSSSL